MPRVKRRSDKMASEKIKVQFDAPLLDTLIKYIRCEYVSNANLNKLRRFISFLDLDAYQYEDAIYPRLKMLNTLLAGIIDESLTDPALLRTYALEHCSGERAVLDMVSLDKNQLTSSECDYLSKAITTRLQTVAIYKAKNDIIDSLTAIDMCNFSTSYDELVHKIRDQMMALVGELQSTDDDQGLMKDFAFSLQDAAALIDSVVKKSKRPAAILQTGIRQLNAILAPGFQSGRLYTILGASGRFKSGTLLNIADQIRRFNPQIPPYENGMRKCILFITLENSIEETLERIYDMYSDVNDDLRDKDTKEVMDTFREAGGFKFSATDGIDIYFKYAGNLEINTAQIHQYIKELREKGMQPICVVLDYIKRIDSVHPSYGDERVRMSFVTKELKNIAQLYEIPIITAMQLNREGNSIIDAAMRESKQDVARFVGSSSIGNAWDIIEDSDWVCLINLEMQRSTNQLFLTFKRLKIRGKSSLPAMAAVDYFNHPFANAKNIRLETDVDKEHTVSVISLATDLESIEEKESSFNELPKDRPTLEEIKKNSKGKVLSSLSALGISAA